VSVAYVDTSAVLAIAFEEEGAEDVQKGLDGFSRTISANLLDAELRAAASREGDPFEPDLLANLDWVLPDRPLGPEMARALEAGYLTGADLWHVAVALSVALDPSEITFVTLDKRQRSVAARLGFEIWQGEQAA